MEILNRKAHFDYFIEEEYEAGIVLTGTEIKSIRSGNCNIKDCYGIVRNGEVYLSLSAGNRSNDLSSTVSMGSRIKQAPPLPE